MRKYIFGFFLLILASIFIFISGCASQKTKTLLEMAGTDSPELNWACLQYDKDKTPEEIRSKKYPVECFGPTGLTKETYCLDSARNTFKECFETCFVVNKFGRDACQLECENDASRKNWSCKNTEKKI